MPPSVFVDFTQTFMDLKKVYSPECHHPAGTMAEVVNEGKTHLFPSVDMYPFVCDPCSMVRMSARSTRSAHKQYTLESVVYDMSNAWFKVARDYAMFAAASPEPDKVCVEMTYSNLLEFGGYTKTSVCDTVRDAVVTHLTTCLIDDSAARRFYLYARDGGLGAACEMVAPFINRTVIDNVASKNDSVPIDLLVVMGIPHDLIPYVRMQYITTPEQKLDYVNSLDAYIGDHNVVQDEAKKIDRELQFPATRLRKSVPLMFGHSVQLCENVTVKISLVEESGDSSSTSSAQYCITLVDKSEPLTSNAELKIISTENRLYKVVASKENGFIGKLKCHFASYYVSPDQKIRLQFKRW
jgi:hypothetical protein